MIKHCQDFPTVSIFIVVINEQQLKKKVPNESIKNGRFNYLI